MKYFIMLPEFLLGVALALFISLLAWGDQIRKPKEELLIIEKNYFKNIKKEKTKILPLLRQSSKSSFQDRINTIFDLGADKNISASDLELITKIKDLHKIRNKIENYYDNRYNTTIGLTVLSFFFGGLSFFLRLEINLVFLSIVIITIFYLLKNLHTTNKKEKLFFKKLYNILDKLEDS